MPILSLINWANSTELILLTIGKIFCINHLAILTFETNSKCLVLLLMTLLMCRFADYGTMLEIKDWVLLPDGCSILTTVGMRRFQVLSRGEKDGYDTAQVKFLADVPIHHQSLKGE